MNLDEYMSYDATGLAELVAAKEVTAKELLALARKRAQQVNGKINAIVIDVDKEADEQAAGVAQRLAAAWAAIGQRDGLPGLNPSGE